MTGTSDDEAHVAKAWDGNARTWSDDVRAGHDRYREVYTWPAFRAFLPPIAGLEILDLGCGEGENTRRLARDGATMSGIDLSGEMIALACGAEAAESLGIAYEIGSYADLTAYADRSFDACVSTMALMDGPRLADAFRAAHRVLRPGGWLAFSVLHPCFFMKLARWPTKVYGEETHLEVGDYFAEDLEDEHWHFSKADRAGATAPIPFRIPRFAHRLEDYLNAIAESGLVLERACEPRASEQAARENPWLWRFRRHAPIVLMILARRPAAS